MKLAAMVIAFFALVPVSHAQQFPVKPIRVIVPFPPGVTDTYVRMIGASMQGELGQPVVPESRPGAAGMIGIEAAARSPADGYTLLVAAAGNMVLTPLINTNAPYDGLKDFTPITTILRATQSFVVRSSLPVQSFRDLVDYAKANPGKLVFGSPGTGTPAHLEIETLKRALGVNILHVPYKGTPQILQAMLGQEVDLSSMTLGTTRQLILAGKLRLVAVYNGRAPAELPQAPDLVQSAPGFIPAPNFLAMFAPAGVPRPVLARVSAAASKAIRSPEIMPKLEEGGATAGGEPSEELASAMRAAAEASARIVKAARDAGVKFE
jgi:tripartite-type tricarboxylate transporter receptor subunit TctC